MEAVINRTTKEDQKIALASLSNYLRSSTRAIDKKDNIVRIEVDNGETITIPKKAFTLLMSILSNMAEGKSITLIPSESEITTQHAADMLNVSRPHIVKLLESGKIPFKKVGKHRRILLKDLIKYENNLREERRKNLDILAKEAQVLNLGY